MVLTGRLIFPAVVLSFVKLTGVQKGMYFFPWALLTAKTAPCFESIFPAVILSFVMLTDEVQKGTYFFPWALLIAKTAPCFESSVTSSYKPSATYSTLENKRT